MKYLLFGVLSLVWMAAVTAYPLTNEENVALDTAHEAHLGVVGGVEKPPATAAVPLEQVKSAEGAIDLEAEAGKVQSEAGKVQSEPDLKAKPAAEAQASAPVVEAAAPATEEAVLVPQAAESLEPVVSKSVVALVPQVAEPEAAVVAIVEEPVKALDIDEERIARAYQYPINNFATYGDWQNNADFYQNYGGYFPQGNQYPGYYPQEAFFI